MNVINKKTTTMLALLASLSLSGMAFATDTISTTSTTTDTTTTATAIVENKININMADAQAISGKIKGIGLKRAEAIVAYRTEHGAYKSLNDLAQVKGIGENFVQKHLDELNQTFTLS